MMLSSRNFGHHARDEGAGNRARSRARSMANGPEWMAALQLLDAVVLLVARMGEQPGEVNGRVVRFSQPPMREEGRAA